MANQDNEFNFYNSENDGYRGGFGGYTDSNPNQSQGGPEAPQGPQKHRGSGRRIAALILACAVVGGGAGVGGAALYSSVFASQPSVIYQNTQPISTQADPVASSSGQAMTPEQLYAANVDACVGITVSTTMTNIFGYTSTSAASGSGFVITADGYIVTNYHVIEGASRVTVVLHSGEEIEAEVIGGGELQDIALLKVDRTDLSPATLGDSDQVRTGEFAIAIGSPLGDELSGTTTYGIISYANRTLEVDGAYLSMIQTDAAINAGNSGGALLNVDGEVIGINSRKTSGSTSSGSTIEGIGFAIPINDVKDIVEELIATGKITRPGLGITGQEVHFSNMDPGILVVSVNEGSPAEAAGMKQMDIITAIDGQQVTSFSSLQSVLYSHDVGDTVTITVLRSGETLDLQVTLAEVEESGTQE